jgi:hypothetical protein
LTFCVLTAVNIKITIFWDATKPGGKVSMFRRNPLPAASNVKMVTTYQTTQLHISEDTKFGSLSGFPSINS